MYLNNYLASAYNNKVLIMKLVCILLTLGLTISINAQSLQSLNQNNVNAMITDAGFFFNTPGVNTGGYEIPSGSGIHTIYSSAFWFGGTDINGHLKLAGQDVYGSNSDLWPGPLTLNSATAIIPNPLGQTIWSVTLAEINDHIANYNQPGYIIPTSIENWPAHGDTTLGLSYFLAPFVDTDFNGFYDPSSGDYPCIKGDRTVYTIMNDKADVHGSGGNPIGIEVHFMFYQFNSTDYLNNTTFIDIDVFNRGTQTIFDFKTSFVYDGDIGNPADDFYGCDSLANIMYMYNADEIDENTGSINGYGANPPSAGMACLSHDMESAISFSNGAVFPYSDPASALQKWSVMNGFWIDGSPVYDDLGQVTKYQYSGNPNNPGEWSELELSNSPGDRRGVMTVGDGFLEYEGHKKYTFAVLYDRSGTTEIENVNGLLSVANFAQTFFDSNLDEICDVSVMGVEEIEPNTFRLYPNPSIGIFNIEWNSDAQVDVLISDISGRIVYKYFNLHGVDSIIQVDLPAGIYTVNVILEGGILTEKLIIE